LLVEIIFHCSASRFGNAALIATWHTLPPVAVVQNGIRYQGRGWRAIGYHYVILNGWLSGGCFNPVFDGHLETGRPLDSDGEIESEEIGAHVLGHNRNSVGVCLIGESGQFTERQLNTARRLVLEMKAQFKRIAVFQHSELNPSKPLCAGLDMDDFRDSLVNLA